jgi:hypothetical protein
LAVAETPAAASLAVTGAASGDVVPELSRARGATA